ncbi:MAG: hypothetical protein H0W63_01260 [Gemmatimonadaceae bacterium]|nr:hypothetical protein [Gemmatimonadaceae bacterium]
MLRAILMLGLLVVLGMFAAGLVFNVLGGLVGLVIWAAVLAVKLLVVGGILYLGLCVLSPNTAQRLKERWTETRVQQY